jgi:ubiquinone/menaquinone biosynthesis C-methylase UbiE
MTGHGRSWIPAAGRDWLLPLYDPLLTLLGVDSARRELLAQASLRPGHRVLDVGCGTGSLVVMIKRLDPEIDVVGLDPDPKALARARRKLARAGLAAQLDRGFSNALPYRDGSFYRVFSCFVFHHLESHEKAVTLAEARRVLEPGGSLHVLDFGSKASQHHGFLSRALHSSERMRDNAEGRIPVRMGEAGFADAGEIDHRMTVLGRIAYYAGSTPLRGR